MDFPSLTLDAAIQFAFAVMVEDALAPDPAESVHVQPRGDAFMPKSAEEDALQKRRLDLIRAAFCVLAMCSFVAVSVARASA